MGAPVPTPPPPAGAFTNDPVRVAWVLNLFVGSTITVLLGAKVIEGTFAAVVTGLSTAAFTAFSLLFVSPNTVATAPLEQLAREQNSRTP